MQVFISWSGEKSKEIAGQVKEFLEIITPDISVFFSTEDIRSGGIWFEEIRKQLENVNYGIIVLTDENKEAPWLLFEAGALFKGVSMNSIIPLAVDIDPSEIHGPLGAFQAMKIDEKNMFKISKEIKEKSRDTTGVSQSEMTANEYEKLMRSFSVAWRHFHSQYTLILSNYARSVFDLTRMKNFINQDNNVISNIIEKASPSKRGLNFHYKKDINIKESHFVMLGYIFDEPVDWTLYCDNGYLIKFNVEMNNIKNVMFQLKTLEYNIEVPIERILNFNELHYEIEISAEHIKKIKYVKEICFTIFNQYMLEGDCKITVSDLRIEK